MSVRLSCPSCNTAFALPALPEPRRATCPRCGDVFPIRTFSEEASDERQAPPDGTGGRPVIAVRVPGEGRRMLGVVAAAIVLILLAGLPPFLTMLKKPKGKVPEPAPAATTAKPASQLGALAYLRADCNIVFAVQPGPLLAYAERTKQEPRDVLAQSGLPDAARNVIDQLGVDLSRIDHLAGGITLGEGEDAFRFALVLVLRQPLADEDAFLTNLKAKPVAGKKSQHDVVVGKIPLLLVRVSPTVFAFGFGDKDLDAVEKADAPGGAPFRGPGAVLADVPPDAAVWLAADDERDWTKKPILKTFGGVAEVKKWLPAVRDGRGASVAVSLGEQPRLRVHVRTANAATGDRVRAYFAARAAETQSATSGGAGDRAHFEAPFNAPGSGKLLQRFLTDAGK